VEDVLPSRLFDAAVSVVERAAEAHPNGLDWRVDELWLRDAFNEPFLIFRSITETARLDQCGDQREMFRFVFLREIAPEHEDFLGVARFEFGAGSYHPSRICEHGERVPRFADAIAVQVTGAEIGEYLRWRNDD